MSEITILIFIVALVFILFLIYVIFDYKKLSNNIDVDLNNAKSINLKFKRTSKNGLLTFAVVIDEDEKAIQMIDSNGKILMDRNLVDDDVKNIINALDKGNVVSWNGFDKKSKSKDEEVEFVLDLNVDDYKVHATGINVFPHGYDVFWEMFYFVVKNYVKKK